MSAFDPFQTLSPDAFWPIRTEGLGSASGSRAGTASRTPISAKAIVLAEACKKLVTHLGGAFSGPDDAAVLSGCEGGPFKRARGALLSHRQIATWRARQTRESRKLHRLMVTIFCVRKLSIILLSTLPGTFISYAETETATCLESGQDVHLIYKCPGLTIPHFGKLVFIISTTLLVLLVSTSTTKQSDSLLSL